MVSKSVTPVGNSSVLNTESNLMDKCHLTKPLEEVMMLSTLSSLKPVPVNTSQDLSSLILNQPSLMKSEPEPTDNYSTQNNLSLVKKMPLTTSLEVTIPLVKKSSILPLIESENLLITVLVSKVSWSSMPSEEVLDLVSDLSY